MYKVVLYGENSATAQAIEVMVKTKIEPIRDNEGSLIFSNDSKKKIAEFNRGAWMYWEEIDEEV